MEQKEISIKDISIIQNSRTRTDKSDVSLLMEDIKQHGLLHPIGVFWDSNSKRYILLYGSRRLSAFDKLGYKTIPAVIHDEMPTEQELILINTAENVHREDLKPHELGRIATFLYKKGMSKKEIAVKMGTNLNHIDNVMKIFAQVPKEMWKDIENVKNSRNVKGILSSTTVKQILSIRAKKPEIVDLLRYAKTHSLTGSQISTFDSLFRAGKNFKEALESMENSRTIAFKSAFKKKQLENYCAENKVSPTRYIYEVLKGQRKPNPNLVI